MDIKILLKKIEEKYGKNLHVVFYPDGSGHVNNDTYQEDRICHDLLAWENLSELNKKLRQKNPVL